MSGREVFEFRPDLIDEDDDEADDTRYANDNEEDEEEYQEEVTQSQISETLLSVQILPSSSQFNLALCDFVLICALGSSHLKKDVSAQ